MYPDVMDEETSPFSGGDFFPETSHRTMQIHLKTPRLRELFSKELHPFPNSAYQNIENVVLTGSNPCTAADTCQFQLIL